EIPGTCGSLPRVPGTPRVSCLLLCFLKGASIMTLVPLTACCLSLGVDPKTLRLWLQAAQLSWCRHPADARKKCLTLAQLQQVAALHGRPLPPAVAQAVASPACAPASEQSSVAPSPQPDEVEVRHQLSLLSQQVSTLQAQVTELALLL